MTGARVSFVIITVILLQKICFKAKLMCSVRFSRKPYIYDKGEKKQNFMTKLSQYLENIHSRCDTSITPDPVLLLLSYPPLRVTVTSSDGLKLVQDFSLVDTNIYGADRDGGEVI